MYAYGIGLFCYLTGNNLVRYYSKHTAKTQPKVP